MTSYKKQYWNEAKTKSVLIHRTRLSDGYNYYIMLLAKAWSVNSPLFINESFKQVDEILSEESAIKIAKELCNTKA